MIITGARKCDTIRRIIRLSLSYFDDSIDESWRNSFSLSSSSTLWMGKKNKEIVKLWLSCALLLWSILDDVETRVKNRKMLKLHRIYFSVNINIEGGVEFDRRKKFIFRVKVSIYLMCRDQFWERRFGIEQIRRSNNNVTNSPGQWITPHF